MSRAVLHREQVFAVLRFDTSVPIDDAVTVKEIVWELETAATEVARLNALNSEMGCRYAWQATRLYPPGHAAGSQQHAATTEPGYVNRNRQKVVRETGLPGNDYLQRIYVLQCGDCKAEYGANGSDVFQRLCPTCQGGAPGLAF